MEADTDSMARDTVHFHTAQALLLSDYLLIGALLEQ